MRFALNSLAVAAPEWLLTYCQDDWLHRYGHRIEAARLPTSRIAQEEWAEVVGKDGTALLEAIFASTTPAFLREIPAVTILRQIWVQNYARVEGQVHWRATEDTPPASCFISSPYDRQARYSKKGGTRFYRVQAPIDRNV